jgi:hypothetical protein
VEAHDAPLARPRAGDDHEPEHEQRVGEQAAEDARLCDHDLPRLEREDDDEQLRQVAERRLQHAGQAGTDVVAEGVGAERDEPRQPRQRDRHEREDDQPVDTGVVERAAERGGEGHEGEPEALSG